MSTQIPSQPTIQFDQVRAPAPGEISTRTEDTEKNYRGRALSFELQASTNLGIQSPGPLVVAAYALERREEWAKSTWRQNKAALIFHYSCLRNRESLEAVSLLRDGRQTPCVTKTDRTSAKRAKTVSVKALNAVLVKIRQSSSKYASLLEAWMLLGAEVGLRPHEWGQSTLIYSSPLDLGDVDAPITIGAFGDAALVPYLRIRNAKATNGRSHGSFRHLNMSGINPGLVDMVGEFAAAMTVIVEAGQYGLHYSGCCKLLWRINASLNGKSSKKFIQLYSPRHKFSSDAKKALDAGGVAALMGHATTKTASEHYGRRISSTGSLGPRPIESEIIRVRKIRGFKAKNPALIPMPPAMPDVT